jgi:hypothetical protein
MAKRQIGCSEEPREFALAELPLTCFIIGVLAHMAELADALL